MSRDYDMTSSLNKLTIKSIKCAMIGFGFANLENNVRMQPENIMRIASISKSMTMAMLAKLMEEGKIDIDKPIQTYLPTYPEKYVDGEKVRTEK